MSDDFYTMVDSGDPAPDNEHITGVREERDEGEQTTTQAPKAMYAARIAVYDDMLSTPRVIVIDPQDVRTYLEETTNTVYQCMKEQGGHISLMVIREIVENFIHAHFAEPIISILDGGDTIRFADQGPGIDDKERAFDFGVTSANSNMKRYIRGTGAGFPMVQEYLENAGGAVSIEDNMGSGTVVTVSLDPKRVQEIERAGGRGAAVRPETEQPTYPLPGAFAQQPMATQQMPPLGYSQQFPQQYQQGYQQPYQQMPQQQYNPWAQQMPPQPYQQWPQSFQQQMPTVQSSQQPAAQMMYPNAANQYAQPQPDVFVSDRGNAALGYLAQNQACGATDLARAFGNSAPTWSRTLNDLAQAGLVIKHGQKYHLTELGAARVRAQG
ncbi:ATP-binding protein [Collinsella sp. OM07-12]|jgi:hypothetical protein|uniref:ATP-binding protein n=1 Tax=unclassified Collinsella TaxID=2637548 RepID=UPI000E445666|nr:MULTISPECIES: ATP-binding protein [unclassified Collinsella]RGM73506.1 ATP-binding protein [Collinsella sp. OM07-12]RHL22542.1 ATP-binding protein [Collinsella sp. AF38-3AC]